MHFEDLYLGQNGLVICMGILEARERKRAMAIDPILSFVEES